MRKLIPILALFTALLWAYPAAAYAAGSNTEQASRVNITVVMPDTSKSTAEPEETEPQDTPAVVAPTPVPAPLLYPVNVDEIRENGGRRIVKVYELSPGENPAKISREPFERDGWRFELTDIIKAETAFADSRAHVETVTLNTDTKDTAAILGQLEPTLAYESEDGYSGILTLNVASVKVEQAGTKTSSYTMTATREYPHLSAADTSLVPKTITDGGKTYTLSKVDWRAGNTVTVDYVATPEYYTAVASYTATGSKTVVTGYVTTAEYTGAIGKISEGKTVYTAYFFGTEITPEITPLEIVSNLPASVTGTLSGSANEAGSSETPESSTEPASETETPQTTTEPPATETTPTEAGSASEQTASPIPLVVPVALIALVVGCGAGYLFTIKYKKTGKEGVAHEKTD